MRTQRRVDERGAVAVLVACFSLVMFVLAGLIVDLGQARDVRRESQNAADASALAAGNVLYPSNGICTDSSHSPCLKDAVAAAKAYALRNDGVSASDWTAANSGCSVPAGFFKEPTDSSQCITFDSLTAPTKVHVVIPIEGVKTTFGVLADVDHVNVNAAARSTLETATQGKCALCFLGPVTVGNGDFDISGSSVHVNGDLNIGSTSYWTAAHIYVAGAWNASDAPRLTPDPESALTITDPYATDSRMTPSTAGLTTKAAGTSPCAGGPGIYGSYTWGANEDCSISPGLYVIDGTWQLKNNSGITGLGVTLYVRNGALDFKNSGKVNLKAPTSVQAAATPSNDVADWVIIYGRSNPNEIGLQGNGTTTNAGSGCSSTGVPSLVGGIYAPMARLSVNGNSCLGVDKGPIVVLGVTSNASGDFNGTKSGLKLSNGQEASIDNMPKSLHLDQ